MTAEVENPNSPSDASRATSAVRPSAFAFASVGLAGSHRTGKSTTARTFARRHDFAFIKTATNEVFAALNLKPSDSFDFATRLEIQGLILDSYERAWRAASRAFITDRTPLDLIAYTLADIQGATQVDYPQLEAYITRCFASTNRFFSHLVLIQPGIPLIYAEGKAALNEGYIEHLNALITGACYDERNRVPVLKLPRAIIDLQSRIQLIRDFVDTE